ncbi:hypothetical protein [Parasporobacterium paucivorans]|uniref:PH domain-containing protein n=1 Tax=Parasporobacterium paucivorans DSM 15970 TaxID=1122934 RepID=A0A1M6JL78_9FIRM|nr:hypothetical protein [Parasporobacterium paucivorans]SHJ47374.1 hypothetical protein SAMN02745691_02028 [Parasporobacterium paucivorans DSM 15970]
MWILGRNNFDNDGERQKGVSRGITVTTIIAVLVLVIISSQPTKVTFLDEGLKIHGMYGDVYEWESVENVRLLDELPEIGVRTNGSAIGPNLKGYFSTQAYGTVKLFVNTGKPPFVFFEYKGKIIIFNLINAEKTKLTLENILIKTEMDENDE